MNNDKMYKTRDRYRGDPMAHLDNIPLWVSIPLIAILGVVALYKCYILPGYNKDRAEYSTQNRAEE